jgi:hypothetical protein
VPDESEPGEEEDRQQYRDEKETHARRCTPRPIMGTATGLGQGGDGNPAPEKGREMKLRRNLYAAVGMAAWKYGMPYAKKKWQARQDSRRAGSPGTATA